MMQIREHQDRRVLGAALVGAVLVLVGWLMTRDTRVPSVEDKVILALGLILLGLVIASALATQRSVSNTLVVLSLATAAVEFGLVFQVRLLSGSDLIVLLGGALLAVLASAWLLTDISGADRPSTTEVVLFIGGGAAMCVGSFLAWIRGVQIELSGMDIPPGKYVLGFGVATMILAGAGYALQGRAASLALSLASAVAVAGAAFAIDVGYILDPAPIQFGLYLVIVGAIVAAAVGIAMQMEAVGFPDPLFPPWVGFTFIGLGIFGMVLGIGMADAIEDRVTTLYPIRLGAALLLVTGLGLSLRQKWAWFLGFAVAGLGILNGILGLFVTETRPFSWFALVLYGNAINALWKSRGEMARAESPAAQLPMETPVSPPPAAPPEPVVPTPPPPPSPVTPPPAPAPAVVPQPAPVTQVVTPAPRPVVAGGGQPRSTPWLLVALIVAIVAIVAYSVGRGGTASDESPAAPEAVPAESVEEAPPSPVEAPVIEESLILERASSSFTQHPDNFCIADVVFKFQVGGSLPPEGSPAMVRVTGPGFSKTYVQPLIGNKVRLVHTLNIKKNPGLWTGEVRSVGGIKVFGSGASTTFTGVC